MSKIETLKELNRLKEGREELMKEMRELRSELPETPAAQFDPVVCIRNNSIKCSPVSCACICNFEDIIKRAKEARDTQ